MDFEPHHDRLRPRNELGTARGADCRVLFVASEIYPMAKTGGLADVCGALPVALASLGVDIRLVMPAYPRALDTVIAPRRVIEIGEVLGVPDVCVIAARTPDSALPIWLVDSPGLFRRAGGPYQDERGNEWPDNGLRFAVLSRVAAWLAGAGTARTGWTPDIVHCHDWHTGLVPLLLQTAPGSVRPRSVFTIHNAAYQGNYPLHDASRLGISHEHIGPEGLEFHGKLSMLKAGIRYADRVTTVSPTYASELLTPEHGCGMQGVLAQRGTAFSGILNGIDTEIWNPRSDPHLAHNYCVLDPGGKAACKRALTEELQLSADGPLAIMVSRLTTQKMADVVLAELPSLLMREPTLQFALLGCGDSELERGFAELGAAHPGRLSVRIGYDEPSAHRMHAAADLLVHGSRFEPCGLVQMYAMRYGTAPVVSRVGGLADSVTDARIEDPHPDAIQLPAPSSSPSSSDGHAHPGAEFTRHADAQRREPPASDASINPCHGTGFVFEGCTGDALQNAIVRAVATWRDRPSTWRRLQARAMQRDFGWPQPAREYLSLYASTARSSTESRSEHVHH